MSTIQTQDAVSVSQTAEDSAPHGIPGYPKQAAPAHIIKSDEEAIRVAQTLAVMIPNY